MSEDTVQVTLDGDVLLVHPDDVVRDESGRVVAVRPRVMATGQKRKAPRDSVRPRRNLQGVRDELLNVFCEAEDAQGRRLIKPLTPQLGQFP
jgi:hypothetical protein